MTENKYWLKAKQELPELKVWLKAQLESFKKELPRSLTELLKDHLLKSEDPEEKAIIENIIYKEKRDESVAQIKNAMYAVAGAENLEAEYSDATKILAEERNRRIVFENNDKVIKRALELLNAESKDIYMMMQGKIPAAAKELNLNYKYK